ncbi:MAG: hypothetical protein P8016_03950 [Sedimentisphaerales bacterium]|jgi:uncharacterized protein YceK
MFKKTIRLVIIFAVTIILTGCGSRMTVRTYDLPQGDTSWEAITMVLQQEWHEQSTMSHAERNGDSAVVKTTSRGHRKIKNVLKTR